MADELTSGVVPESPDEGQDKRTGQPSPDSAPPAKREAPAGQDKPQSLFDSEDFRRVQSSWQQKLEQERVARQATERRLQELEERGLDDFEKLQLRLKREQQEKQQLYHTIQSLNQERESRAQIDADMAFISSKTGIPVHQLRSAKTYDEAWDMGKDYLEKQLAAKYTSAADDQPQTTNRQAPQRPFVGQGKPSTARSKIEKAIDEAETTEDLIKLWYSNED